MEPEYKIKDEILRHVSKNPGKVYSQVKTKIVKILKMTEDEIVLQKYISDIIKDGFIKQVNTGRVLLLKITEEGYFFLNQKKGYTALNKEKIRKTTIHIFKTIVLSINASAIIFISYLNYEATDRANDNKIESDRLHVRIDSLERSNDSLIFIYQKLIDDTSRFHR